MDTPAPSPEPLRPRRVVSPSIGSRLARLGRRILHVLLVLVTVVLVVDALFGDKGLFETLRVRRQYQELASSLDRLRRDNARLREEARRLREEPAAIEEVARRELGLIRPGEMVFIVKDRR
jgi:cell division protein FtsB